MKQEKICLACRFSDEDEGPLQDALLFIDNEVALSGVKSAIRPKMKTHLTILTPFLATKTETKFLASALEFQQAISRTSEAVMMCTYVDIKFIGDNGALVLIFKISLELKKAIERWRAQVAQIHDWAHPPEDYLFFPHITYGEGREFRSSLAEKRLLPIFKEHIQPFTIILPPPLILMKESAGWVPIVA